MSNFKFTPMVSLSALVIAMGGVLKYGMCLFGAKT